ncbi:Os05g0383750 [Oryza sativa Japonica Group]|uniref:Os05g0383750 protein n=1 Tax=Oryza sativa subsp. japonica TaxID=39947 RepID=A0A0P0WLT7_ORYSJ|nr:Os05g0383750 [Oryza sativa Japonica Group]
MAGRAPAVAIAFLVLVVMPGMASAGKIPRFLVSPKTGKALRDFFKNHAKDVVGLLPTGSPSSSQGATAQITAAAMPRARRRRGVPATPRPPPP